MKKVDNYEQLGLELEPESNYEHFDGEEEDIDPNQPKGIPLTVGEADNPWEEIGNPSR